MKTAIPKTFLLFTFSTLFAFSFFRCSPNEPTPNPPEPEKSVSLSVTDFSLNEIYLELATENLSSDKRVEIYRDDNIIFNFTLNGTDTAVVDDSLFPSSSYSYHSLVIENGKDTVFTDTITASTMDTTSHDFTWETYAFGGGDPSVLYDVAIISENDIWAVGEIHTEWTDQYDSAGVWVQPYNAVHWNGNEWELRRIKWLDGRTYEKNTIFVFNNNDILFGPNILFDGENYRYLQPLPVDNNGYGWQANSMWGTSSEDFYVVGKGGNIAHYNGSSWEKIESGTEMFLTDIYGSPSGEIYVSGSNIQYGKGLVIKRTDSNQWETMITSDIIDESQLFEKLYGSISGIWIDERGTLVTGGSFLFEYKNNEWDYVKSLPNNCITCNPLSYRGYIYTVRGNGSNDYFIGGDRNTLVHFNGISWHRLGPSYNLSGNIVWVKVKQQGDLAVAVGIDGGNAAIIMLRR
jgi:hypothetical protein